MANPFSPEFRKYLEKIRSFLRLPTVFNLPFIRSLADDSPAETPQPEKQLSRRQKEFITGFDFGIALNYERKQLTKNQLSLELKIPNYELIVEQLDCFCGHYLNEGLIADLQLHLPVIRESLEIALKQTDVTIALTFDEKFLVQSLLTHLEFFSRVFPKQIKPPIYPEWPDDEADVEN